MASDTGLDLIFAILDLVIEIADDSSRKSSGLFSLFGNSSSRAHKVGATNALMKIEEERFKNNNPEPVYEPIKNKPVKTVSQADRMAAFAAIKSGKTVAARKPEKIFGKAESEQKRTYPISRTAKQLKLEVFLLSYMFQEDDGRISSKEKRAIKKHYKSFVNKLTKEDVEDIRDMNGMDNSLMNIRAFISQHKVDETTITNSIRTLKELNKEGDRYRSIINRIETSLLESMGY